MSASLSDGFMETALSLLALTSGRGRPREADLRRAVSTAYYAMFHTVCEDAANLLVGTVGADRSDGAWCQVYRGMDHRCFDKSLAGISFPAEISLFHTALQNAKKNRHDADYNPLSQWSKNDVQVDVRDIRHDIAMYAQLPAKHRRAYIIWLLFKNR